MEARILNISQQPIEELTYDEKYNIWVQDRRKGLGGSDASAIIGIKNNVQLWRWH